MLSVSVRSENPTFYPYMSLILENSSCVIDEDYYKRSGSGTLSTRLAIYLSAQEWIKKFLTGETEN